MPYQLTPEHAKLWLPVVRELREYYERKNDKFKYECPLCKMADFLARPCDISCGYCLWMLFEGEPCRNPVEMKRKNRPQSWCKQSIKRLKRWEKKLKKIIKGG